MSDDNKINSSKNAPSQDSSEVPEAEIDIWVKRIYDAVMDEPIPEVVLNALPMNDNSES